MRSRALFASVVLSCAVVSGGWLMERGLLGATPDLGARSVLFNQVLAHVAHDYVDTLADSTLYLDAVNGLVDELHDPHSEYLSPKLLSRLSESTSGRYAGIGAQIDVRDGSIIVSPLPGGPAAAAGIEVGDRITEIDGKTTRALGTSEAQKALRGPPNSVVRLTIERTGVESAMKFAVTRQEIHVHSVQHATMLRDGIGFVALTIFSDESARELQQAIDSLRAAGMHSLILDLRGDPGGLLDEGVGVAELFLDKGQRIVSMRGRTPDATRVYADDAPQRWPAMPLALLVDSSTASAAEIVSGALQDHDRAVVLGTVTYGKGSAQNVFSMPNGGALKLTTALWYTPSGRSINRIMPGDTTPPDTGVARPRYHTDAGRAVLGGGGITPDVLLPAAGVTTSDTAFARALGSHIPAFRDAVTEYALSLKGSPTIRSPDFVVTPAMRSTLQRRLAARGVTVDSATYAAAAPLIDRLLGYEIARYSFGAEAEFRRQMRDDPAIASAQALMAGATTEAELLKRAAASAHAAPGGGTR